MSFQKTKVSAGAHIDVPAEGLLKGSKLTFLGKVDDDPECHFAINLKVGKEHTSDVSLHFNPRLGTSPDVHINSYKGGWWGFSERGKTFPFKQGTDFSISIEPKPNHYTIVVNGKHFKNFDYRRGEFEPSEVRFVHVTAGATWKEVKYTTP